jgi:rRNA maturation RNase YbeY
MAVFYHFNGVKATLRERRRLGAFLDQIFTEHGRKLRRLDYVFCSDDFLLKVNQQYLDHDTYTDIITFDLTEDEGVQGEIYISLDRIRENASEFGVRFEEELHRVIFHGVLHLCGFGDKKATEKKIMRQHENELLRRYFN